MSIDRMTAVSNGSFGGLCRTTTLNPPHLQRDAATAKPEKTDARIAGLFLSISLHDVTKGRVKNVLPRPLPANVFDKKVHKNPHLGRNHIALGINQPERSLLGGLERR